MDLLSLLIMSTCGVILGILVMALTEEVNDLRKQAIEHGYAQHNPATGEWEWK